MRVDLKAVAAALKGSGLLRYFREIEAMEKYTLLTPPYTQEDARELTQRAQDCLQMRFSGAYAQFMQCCDGGWLFTNQIYSLLCPDDAQDDLVEMNRFLRREGLIPAGSAAIGETNYGAYIVQCASSRNVMGLWNSDEQRYIARYEHFGLWLEDVLEEARFLLKENALEEFEEFEVYIGDAAPQTARHEAQADIEADEQETDAEADREGEVLF